MIADFCLQPARNAHIRILVCKRFGLVSKIKMPVSQWLSILPFLKYFIAKGRGVREAYFY